MFSSTHHSRVLPHELTYTSCPPAGRKAVPRTVYSYSTPKGHKNDLGHSGTWLGPLSENGVNNDVTVHKI